MERSHGDLAFLLELSKMVRSLFMQSQNQKMLRLKIPMHHGLFLVGCFAQLASRDPNNIYSLQSSLPNLFCVSNLTMPHAGRLIGLTAKLLQLGARMVGFHVTRIVHDC
jgi:hypothetical protein